MSEAYMIGKNGMEPIKLITRVCNEETNKLTELTFSNAHLIITTEKEQAIAIDKFIISEDGKKVSYAVAKDTRIIFPKDIKVVAATSELWTIIDKDLKVL